MLEGTRQVERQSLRIRVGLGARFPHELPNIYVADLGDMPFLPHVDHVGWVCFAAGEGLSLRASTPDQLVEDAVGRALVTIADGLGGRSARDVYDELEAYWRDLDDGNLVAAHLDPNGGHREILVAFARVGGRPTFPYVADDFSAVLDFDPQAKRHATEKAGLLVRLADTCIEEPLDPRRFSDAGWVRDYVRRHITDADEARLRAITARKKLWPFVVLNVPRPVGGRSLVGLHYEQVHGGHPLLDGETREPVRYVAFDRRDRPSLLARGGAMTNLANTKVALVGCGAVGGHVAINLAASGIGSLHLIDHDQLSSENVFRHVLGRSALGLNKAIAMRAELQRKYPFVRVTADKRRAEDAHAAGDLDWSTFDLVVVTIGDVTVSRRLNAELATARTAALFTWLEPLGIGGHALLAHVDDVTAGCYECLFLDDHGAETLTSTADFAAAGQVFTRDVTGCASVFTPYGNLDASRTAEVAARLAVEALSATSPVPRLRSWRGDPREFTRRYALSERWNRSDGSEHAFARPSCRVCGGAR